MHLDQERLQRWLHAESADPGDRNHAETCPECRKLVEDAEQDEVEIEALLMSVDSEPPTVDPEHLADRARTTGRRPTRRWTRWAAGIMLSIGLGGVAYAVPGSPIRPWVDRLLGLHPPTAQPIDTPVPIAPAPSDVNGGSGVAVDPGEELTLVFDQPGEHSSVRVVLTDRSQVLVQAPAGSASYTTGLDRLEVALLRDSVQVELEIPRLAPRVEIRVGTRRVLLKTGSRITTSIPVAADQTYSFPLSQTPR